MQSVFIGNNGIMTICVSCHELKLVVSKLGQNKCEVAFELTGGPRLVRILGPEKNRTM